MSSFLPGVLEEERGQLKKPWFGPMVGTAAAGGDFLPKQHV